MNWVILAASILLTWVEPTTNVDGSPLDDLKEYKGYQRTINESFDFSEGKEIFTVKKGTTEYKISKLKENHYIWVVKACDNAGNCSYASNEAGRIIVIPPSSPKDLTIK